MAELKTKPTKKSAASYIASIKEPQKRKDAATLLKLFKAVTKEKPVMWGTSIVGFGQYHYKSERSRQEGVWPMTGFSARAQNLTLYFMPGFKDLQSLLKKLGPHKTSVGCLYITRLDKVDPVVLAAIIKHSYRQMQRKYGGKGSVAR